MMRRKPRFAVVTAVVTILAILGALIQSLHPFLPPNPTTNDFSDRGGFLQQAARESIHWLPLSDSDFLEAKQSNKPMFMFVGAEWSRDSRIADQNTFSDPDVQALMSSDYISVRIDCDESPEWLNAFFPLSSYRLGLERGCQGYFALPAGLMYDYLSVDAIAHHRDNADLTQAMLQARAEMKNWDKGLFERSGPLAQQTNDVTALMGRNRGIWPDFASFNDLLMAHVDSSFGGLPSDQLQIPLPDVYRYAFESRQRELLAISLYPILRSPLVDWLDGGFFAGADQDWSNVDFDKIAVCNAALMENAAQAGSAFRDDFATTIAVRTFDALATEFVKDQALLASCRIGDELPDNRSRRSSLNEEDVRSFWNSGILPESDRKWAVKYLNLDLSKNHQLIPWVSDPNVMSIQGPTLDRVLGELRIAKAGIHPRYSQIAYADVNGFVIARMIECARLWNDADRLQKALDFKHRLERLRVGKGVQHRLNQKHGAPELTDYLSYADASLQTYLATGDVHSFNLGLQVLLEAKKLFEQETPGVWLMSRASVGGLPKDYLAPELADNLYESCTAREIRLMAAYSRLLSGNPDLNSISEELNQDAAAAITLFAPAAKNLGVHAAGYYCAAFGFRKMPIAVAVGPRAIDLANDMYRLDPALISAPALGPVRMDLQGRPPGIYLLRGSQVSGPYENAASAKQSLLGEVL